MTPRERLRRCYFHQELDRPAVYSRRGFPQDDPTYDRLKQYLWERSEVKLGWGAASVEAPYPVDHHTEPRSEDWERRVSVLHTPAGGLESTHLVSLKGQPGLQETCYLKTREDAETYLSLPLPEVGGDVSAFFDLQRQIGERGIVQAGVGMNPGGVVAELFGSENFAIMSVTDRDVVHALLQREMKIILNRLNYVLSEGVGPYFGILGQEYIVPPLHGPKDFCDFNVTYDRPILDLIHEAGGRVHVHCHGSMSKVMQGFVEMGADVLHPFEAPPMGDITPAQAKGVARGKLCLEGNIQISAMYEHTPEQVRAETEALMRDAFDDRRGLIVCPTASPYIPGKGQECFPQYKAMIDAVLEWKG